MPDVLERVTDEVQVTDQSERVTGARARVTDQLERVPDQVRITDDKEWAPDTVLVTGDKVRVIDDRVQLLKHDNWVRAGSLTLAMFGLLTTGDG